MALSCIILEIKRDIGQKSWRFITPLYSTPPLGPRRTTAFPFGLRKLECWVYPTVKKVWRYVYPFWQNVQTWQTDRHAHRHRMTAKAALDAHGQKTIVSLSLRLNSTWTDPATSFLCSRAGNKETMVTDNSVARSLHVKILHTTTIVNWYLYQSHDHILSSLTKHL